MRTLSLKDESALTLSSQPCQRMPAEDACKLQELEKLSPVQSESPLLPPPPSRRMLPLPLPLPGPPNPPS